MNHQVIYKKDSYDNNIKIDCHKYIILTLVANDGDFQTAKSDELIGCAINFVPQQSGSKISESFIQKAVFQIKKNAVAKLDAQNKEFRLQQSIEHLQTKQCEEK